MARGAAEIPLFGRAPAGVHVVLRPSAYAVVAATVGATGLECNEEDHTLVWLAPAAAVGALVHESHRWAVERWIERAVDGEGMG